MSLLPGALWHVPVSMYSRKVKPRSRLGWLGEGGRGPAQEFLNSSVEFLTNWGMEQLLTVTAITLFRLSIWGWSAWFTPTPDSVSWLFQSSSALNAPMFLPLIIVIAYLWQHIMANFVPNQVWKRKSLHVYWLLSDTILFNSNIFSMNDLIHRDIKYACLEIQLFRWKTLLYILHLHFLGYSTVSIWTSWKVVFAPDGQRILFPKLMCVKCLVTLRQCELSRIQWEI